MYNQFIDEDSHDKQVQLLVELGFPIRRAREAVRRNPYTETLEELVNKALEIEPSDNQSRKSQSEPKISLVQFSELSLQIPNNPLGEDETCPICFLKKEDYIIFQCQHKFCRECVVKYVQHNRINSLNDIHCLSQDCSSKLQPQYVDQIKLHLCAAVVHTNEPVCDKCRLPKAVHSLSFFSNACESAELNVLNSQIRNIDDQITQRCPQCGIWVQKSNGCNTIKCFYCKFVWCWLCRRQCGPDHFIQFNPLGCPGLGSEDFTITQWPWHKICWKRVKTVLILMLLFLAFFLIYPFFVAYVIVRQQNFNFNVPLIMKGIKALIVVLLFIIISALAIFPGTLIFIASAEARSKVFSQ